MADKIKKLNPNASLKDVIETVNEISELLNFSNFADQFIRQQKAKDRAKAHLNKIRNQ